MAKILIVEDNVDTNEALSEYLQDAGHVIISAYDGTEALAIFAQNKVDLIVLDIMLPTMSGLAVLNAVRRTSQVPVIMLTALEDEYTQVSSFDCLAEVSAISSHNFATSFSNSFRFRILYTVGSKI